MSQSGIGLEIPIRVTGEDGTVVWQGVGLMGRVYLVKNTDSAAIGVGNVVALDPANFIIGASNLAATATPVAQVYAAKRAVSTGSFDRMLIGAAVESIPVGGQGQVAGAGSITVVSVASATGTVGRHLIVGATAGVVTDSATAPTNPAQSPGYTLKPSGTTGGATDTGVATQIGALIQVH